MSHIALTASPTVVAFHRGAKQWSTLFPSSWRSRGINPSSFPNSTRKRLPLRFFASGKNGVNGGVVDEISETVKAHTDFVWPDNKKPRVCILGGGFGGLYTALRLESLQWPEDKKPHVFAQGSQQLSQKIGSRQKNKRDLPVTSLPKKGAFVPRYQISLETLVDSSDMATAGAIRLLDMEEDIFGYSCTETIGKEDLEHIFRHQELGVGVIHTYIRFLYDNFMRGNDQLSNRFRFVSSSLVNKALICREPDSCREYLVKRFMASSTNNLYLWPYNSGCHWLLLAIDPLKEVVYFLNSIDGEWTNYPDMKQLVDTSIKVFRSQRQARVPRTKSSNITWIKVQCPLQRNGIDCGYFVMRFMREIINMNQIEIPITYFDEYKCAHYTRLQLEQIKEELCQYFIEKRLII
ncbi:hypothetical protein KIW84_024391 [Lathyrus oleraceus]|uniref:Ubiquitin-like protease family profile domain-containing protein n=1 Tax=Pisum sativum TaxID=3888 RepID=A0A9D5B7N3_PEA|nr:hypothetical protein KIW84_024391 [Pisum sativum]